jgi:FkbM family methyltransferase
VTHAFYERGWQGINIEPMQSYFERLCSVRPLDTNLPIAVADKESELTFYEIAETGLSTLDAEAAKKHHDAGWDVTERKVSVFTLNQIFEKYLNGPIHFLKIDVEGAEQQVLQGLDLSRWRPWILVVEATIPLASDANYASWETSILAAGYDFVYFDGLNRFYVGREHLDLAQSFTVPPNIFDDFMRYREVAGLTEQISARDIHIKNLSNLVNALEQRTQNIQGELNRVQGELNQVQDALNHVYNSRSWKMTAPMRKVIEKAYGFRHKVRRLSPLHTLPKRALFRILRTFAIKVIIPLSENRTAYSIVNRFPTIKRQIQRLMKRVIYEPQQAHLPASAVEQSIPMSPAVMRIHMDLVNQIKNQNQQD